MCSWPVLCPTLSSTIPTSVEQGQIAGAGIDVWEVEPPPLTHRLLTFDNVVGTYHTAGVTVDSRELMATWNAQQVVQVLNGQYPPRLINPEAWDKFSLRFETALGFLSS